MWLTEAQFFLTDRFCHLVVTWNYSRTVWVRRVCHWGSHLVWLEHQPLGVLIWNITRDCLPVSLVMHLHELGGGQDSSSKSFHTPSSRCAGSILFTRHTCHATKTCTTQSSTSCGPVCHLLYIYCHSMENIPFIDVKGLCHSESIYYTLLENAML